LAKEDFFKELFLDKRVALPVKCRKGRPARRIRQGNVPFGQQLFSLKFAANGFGAFAKQTTSIKHGESLALQELSGTLEVCRDEFSQLNRDPKDRQTQGIAIGLLSLANHSSPFSFVRNNPLCGRSDRALAQASQRTTLWPRNHNPPCTDKRTLVRLPT
jgi:hypothetical protein